MCVPVCTCDSARECSCVHRPSWLDARVTALACLIIFAICMLPLGPNSPFWLALFLCAAFLRIVVINPTQQLNARPVCTPAGFLHLRHV